MQHELVSLLASIARTPLLLVACDYDGTLAEIVPDPTEAVPHLEALQAFRSVAQIHRTRTAIVSGRSLHDLTRFVGRAGPELHVGSHGAEWRHEGVTLNDEQQYQLRHIAHVLEGIVNEHAGLRCEVKPAGVALHFRTADRSTAHKATALAIERCGLLPGVYVRHGSEVVEFIVVAANKGEAVSRVKLATGASAVLFIGDDQTDEDVFMSLSDADLSIKVGAGNTLAKCRVSNVPEVGMALRKLSTIRSEWIKAASVRTASSVAPVSSESLASNSSSPAS